ncbi:hypothetical protein PM082_018889 [Marasmius tenuissimus]|nr:hypothetical protein PM082_018889 [Marasmius tenuissimus]
MHLLWNIHTRTVIPSDYLGDAADHALQTAPLSESDTQSLLVIQAFQPTFSITIGQFSFKKWALDPLGMSPIVKQDLMPLRANAFNYADKLVAIAPAAPGFITFSNQMETALANAQAAFTGA